MIVTKITSGLGNQLFQFAIAKNLSIKNNTSLYFDLSYYKSEYVTDTVRKFKLNNFSINYKLLNTSPVLYYVKSTKLFPDRTLKPFFKYRKEEYFHFNKHVLLESSFCTILDGFWQSEKYFKENANLIRNELTFKRITGETFKNYYKQIQNTKTPISIHIRRGDYVNHPEFSKTFGFVGTDYYERAISLIKSKFPDFRFFIFSDDHEWVKDNLNLSDCVFVENTGEDSDLDDLQLMSTCKHHIIANSSFSWWAAWLNNEEDKLVISPKNWYKNQPTWDTKDLIPETWIRI